jgi:hypothetical protein
VTREGFGEEGGERLKRRAISRRGGESDKYRNSWRHENAA